MFRKCFPEEAASIPQRRIIDLLRALLNGGSFRETSILRPETVALMSENQIGNLEAGILKTTNPGAIERRGFFSGVQLRWGLGQHDQYRSRPDGRKAGSLTWAGLFNTYYWIDPTMRIAGVIMMQILPFADRQALKAYRQFERGICHVLGASLKIGPYRRILDAKSAR